jgi:hypothetical protein
VLARWTIKPKRSACGRRQRRDLGPAPAPAARAARSDGCATTASRRNRSSPPRAIALGFTADLPRPRPGTGGWVDGPNQRIGIQHNLPIKSPEDLARVPVKVSEGKVLKLGDVAKVVENHPPLIGDAIVNDDTGLVLVVEKFPGANTVAVTRAVEGALAELRLGLPGVQLDSSLFRLSSFIEASMENIGWAALVGAVLALLALLAFWLQWRVALIALITVPLSLLLRGTRSTRWCWPASRRAGCVIDDVVVDIENIMRACAKIAGRSSPNQRGRDPRGLPRDAQPAPLRHADRAPGGDPGAVHRRDHRCFLQAARRVLRAGDPRVDGRGARRRPGARLRAHQRQGRRAA